MMLYIRPSFEYGSLAGLSYSTSVWAVVVCACAVPGNVICASPASRAMTSRIFFMAVSP